MTRLPSSRATHRSGLTRVPSSVAAALALLFIGLIWMGIALGSASHATTPLPRRVPVVSRQLGWGAPVQLSIPALQLAASVERKGLTPAGNIDVPSDPDSVAWYEGGSVPGRPGDAVISGHLDTPAGDAVFSGLHTLQRGDAITVTLDGGRTVPFRVTALTYYPYTARLDMLFDTAGPPQLSLITCAGTWDAGRHTYLQRLIVTAIAVS